VPQLTFTFRNIAWRPARKAIESKIDLKVASFLGASTCIISQNFTSRFGERPCQRFSYRRNAGSEEYTAMINLFDNDNAAEGRARGDDAAGLLA
jgi:hypothetical protein